MKNLYTYMVSICLVASMIFAMAAFAKGDNILGGIMLSCVAIYYSAIAIIETIKETRK